MKTITTNELVTVTGGAKNDAITQQLSSLQSSIKDLASSKNNSGGNDTMTMMMMALALRPQPSQAAVVAAPAAPAGPVVNISTRFRRR